MCTNIDRLFVSEMRFSYISVYLLLDPSVGGTHELKFRGVSDITAKYNII